MMNSSCRRRRRLNCLLELFLLILGFIFVGIPTSCTAASATYEDQWQPTASNGLHRRNAVERRQRQLGQNQGQPPDFVNDLLHCSNPRKVNSIGDRFGCDPSTFLWDFTALDPTTPPGICFGVNYTAIYELSLTPGALSDLEEPCYWWNLMYGSMAPSTSPSTSPPSEMPSLAPSSTPTLSPTVEPTTLLPTTTPTLSPSRLASDFPTGVPTLEPMPSDAPTGVPTLAPSSLALTLSPSDSETTTPSTAVPAPPPPTRRPTRRPPPTLRPTAVATTDPTTTTLQPSSESTFDRSSALVRPLADFVVAFYVSPSSSGGRRDVRQHQQLRRRQLLSVNRYQLTALTAAYLLKQLQADFPNSRVQTVELVLTSVAAVVSVDRNSTTNTSSTSSTFQEALSGELLFGTTDSSLVPALDDLYSAIEKSFTDTQALNTYFALLQASKDPVLNRISRVDLIQGASAISNRDNDNNNSTTVPSSQNTAVSSRKGGGGIHWSTGLVAIVAGGGVATIAVAILLYLCVTHKSRKRRRRLRKQQQKEKDSLSQSSASDSNNNDKNNARRAPPPAVDTASPDAKAPPQPARQSRRGWFSWGSNDNYARGTPDLTLQPTASTNSSPLSTMTTPRSQSNNTSPLKAAVKASGVAAAVEQNKRRKVDDFDELLAKGADPNDCFRHHQEEEDDEEEDHSEVTSTYSYIETNTNDEHSISVAPSFLYGPNETGSIMGDYDDFGELVAGVTTRINRSTPWMDELSSSLPSSSNNNINPTMNKNSSASWIAAANHSKSVPPKPPSTLQSKPPQAQQGRPTTTVLPTRSSPNARRDNTAAAQDPLNTSHNLLNMSASYSSFYEYDERKGIMIISHPSGLEDAAAAAANVMVVDNGDDDDDEMPSKIGGSFLMDDSFFSQEGPSQQQHSTEGGLLAVGGDNKGEISILESPVRLPGMDSGSLFLNSPSTSNSSSSPRKGQQQSQLTGRALKQVAAAAVPPVDDNGMGDVLQFYEGTSKSAVTSTNPNNNASLITTSSSFASASSSSPVKGKKFAFDEVWRDIVEEDVDSHVRDTMSVTSAASTRGPSQAAAASPKKGDSATKTKKQASGSQKSSQEDSTADDDDLNSSASRLNRSDASLRMALSPSGSRRVTTAAVDSPTTEATVPKRLSRGDASLRAALMPSGSRRAASVDNSNRTSARDSNDDSFNTSERFNRSDASLRAALMPSGSRRATSVDNPNRLTGSSSNFNTSERFNRSDASLRAALMPTGSQRADSFDSSSPRGGQVNSTGPSRVSLPPSTANTSDAETTRRNQEITAKLWLANRSNDKKSEATKPSRSKSVAPPASGQRGVASSAAGSGASAKRGSSLPPSRHSSLHRVTEELPFDEPKDSWSPTERQIDEASDEGATKFSI